MTILQLTVDLQRSIHNIGCYLIFGQSNELAYTHKSHRAYTCDSGSISGHVSSLVSNCLQYLSFQSVNKGLRKQNTTVFSTVVTKIQALAPIVNSDLMPPGGQYV